MAQDMVVESTVKEGGSAAAAKDAASSVDSSDNPAATTTNTEHTDNANDTTHTSSSSTDTEMSNNDKKESNAKDSGYFGKYNWDSNKKSKEKAVLVPGSGAIVDYAWCDGSKAVSVYIDLPGLDSVPEDELKVSLINDNKGVSFKAKNVGGKYRFLKIDKLNDKVKSVKLIRKKGRDRVVIKLFKEKERKWWNLKEGGSYGGSFDDEYDDDWSEAADDFDDAKDENSLSPMDEDKPKDEKANKPEEEKKDEDVPMEDAPEAKE